MNPHQKQILATLAYYDAMYYPLTAFEIWRHLFDFSKSKTKTSYYEILTSLQDIKERGIISCAGGFWCLKGSENLFPERIKRQKIAVSKIKRAMKWAKWLKFLPFIRAVIFTGTLAMKNTSPASDWDVLTITKKNRIWLARGILTGFLAIFGKWRHGQQTRDRFCLNQFVAENALIFEEQNEFTSKEISFSFPLLGRKFFNKLVQLNEFWLSQYQPNFKKDRVAPHITRRETKASRKIRKIFERVLETGGVAKALNDLIKKKMIKKIERNPLTYLAGANIRYNDHQLVFLPAPQQKKVIEKMLLRLTKIKQ